MIFQPETITPFTSTVWTLNFFTHPIAVPLFTPGHRQSALKELKSRGANDFACLIDPTAIVPSSFEAGTGSYVNCGVTAGGVCRLGRHVFCQQIQPHWVIISSRTITSQSALV